jgi:hypothetical protein
VYKRQDYYDCYQLEPGDGLPFRIELLEAGESLYVAMYDSGLGWVYGDILLPGGVLYLPNDGMPGQIIEVNANDSSNMPYTLSITTAPAFEISGTITDTGMNPLDAQLYVQETGHTAWASVWDGGAYQFYSLLPPGDYTIAVFAAHYDPPANTQQVTISNADVIVNFNNLMAANYDNLEPNDSFMTAAPIMLNTDYSVSIGAPPDWDDYYSIALQAGDRIRISLTPSEIWVPCYLNLYDESTYDGRQGYRLPDGRVVIDYTVPEDATRIFAVGGYAHYMLRVDKLN